MSSNDDDDRRTEKGEFRIVTNSIIYGECPIMTSVQAENIVIGCILTVLNDDCDINVQCTLEDVGIFGNIRLESLVNFIVSDNIVGVPSLDYELDRACLDGISSDNSIASVRLIVQNNAVPIQE